ncbi:pentapeptide repeat-containing protein [Nonomuraea sp. NPDC049758]|uniref:pentapeptide repeat-containing protein n=1 Tax=Nonomuraea sp. NPDC049758 TaxID=3154360 RepID=UPI003412CB83
MGLLRRSPLPTARPPDLRPPRSMWWWALPAALLVGAAAWGVSAWLLQDLDKLPTLAERVSARIEAARTALAAAAGVGAAVTLLLAMRRQRHQELATAHTTHDAAERRVTELYTKAAEQLGNDQAPVRLAGLYALERLAQDTPALRQTIAEVICSYLRMPYTPPREDREEKIRAPQRAARAGRPTRAGTNGGRDPQEERQVRLTAQRILLAHLRYDDSPALHHWWPARHLDRNTRHWPDIRLDLARAVLIDFDLRACRLGDADFRNATFTGNARFGEATFTGNAQFGGATFTRDAWFGGATFTRDAGFSKATFTRDAGFSKATFTGDAGFGGATFTGNAWFDFATFTGDARFDFATFTGDTWFDFATFTGDALFYEAAGLEMARLSCVRVAPVARDVERVWPPDWRVEADADGWQGLRLASDPVPGELAEEAGAAGSEPGPGAAG